MTSRIVQLAFVLVVGLFSCTNESGDLLPTSSPSAKDQGNSGQQNQSGVITAGEWNDLENWSFWENIIQKDDYKSLPAYWSFFNKYRIAVNVISPESTPVVDALVQLKRDGATIFSARTDNLGKAELWTDLFKNTSSIDYPKLTIDINNGSGTILNVKSYEDGINEIVITPTTIANKIEISFVVDATSSMGDELEYLKTELLDVISRIKTTNPEASVSTSSVFYRDEGDEYITRVSNFTNDNNITTKFIQDQSAGGGGDFPEAAHSALDKAINELHWSTNAKTRLLFFVLDAPPHHEEAVIHSIQSSIQRASEKGIKIIPITASGIDKETEFLMRFLALSTNGTYVFITNHSGIGNEHLEATVGEYQVEYLNNLMVRLINKYAQ